MSILLRMYPGDALAFLIANVLVQVTVVILTARLLARLGSRWNAAWRHSIYLVALICVLAAPVLSWVMQATGIALVTLRRSVPTDAPAEPSRIPMAHIPESSLIETPATPQLAANCVHLEAQNLGQGLQPGNPSPPSFSDILRALAAVALVIWLLGMTLLLARWCYGLHLIAALRRAARPLDGEAMVELLRQVRQALGADRLPPMATSAGLDWPVMVGLMRPLVVLPENLLPTLHEPELADVLVHECAHAVCRHQVVGLLQRVAGILFWPHPLVHLLNWELARAREEICDNYVLRRSAAPRYARTLLELSQSIVGVSPKPTALGLFHCHWRLEDRVADLLDRRRRAMIQVGRWSMGMFTVLLLTVTLLIASVRAIQAEPEPQAKPATKVQAANEPKNESAQIYSHARLPMPVQVSIENMKRIALALHNYRSKHGSFPPAYTVDKDGKPLLSSRVLILPYLDRPIGVGVRNGHSLLLHEAFHYDEPWNSPYNKKLLPFMPHFYWSPLTKTEGWKTNYLGVIGKNMMFPGKDSVKLEEVKDVKSKDATSNTIMLVEVSDELAMEWTRPVDFQPSPNQPTKGLGHLLPSGVSGFWAGMVDGSVQRMSVQTDPKVLWSLFLRNGEKPQAGEY